MVFYGIFYLYFNRIFAQCEQIQFEWMEHWTAWMWLYTVEIKWIFCQSYSSVNAVFHEACIYKTVRYVIRTEHFEKSEYWTSASEKGLISNILGIFAFREMRKVPKRKYRIWKLIRYKHNVPFGAMSILWW